MKENNIPQDCEKLVVRRSLKKSGFYNSIVDHINIKKPRGIRRTPDDVINKIWTFWNENSTVSNASTSRPAKYDAIAFDKDPLLKRVIMQDWNMTEEHTKRKKRQYVHQYQVQNLTNYELP